eukprot:COSAG02_NODE_4330_length_5495_cov_21.736471_2_plen_117_part_00
MNEDAQVLQTTACCERLPRENLVAFATAIFYTFSTSNRGTIHQSGAFKQSGAIPPIRRQSANQSASQAPFHQSFLEVVAPFRGVAPNGGDGVAPVCGGRCLHTTSPFPRTATAALC